MRDPGYKAPDRGERTAGPGKRLPVTCCLLTSIVFLCSSCISAPKLPPQHPGYVYKEEKIEPASVNSLWTDRSGLYEDRKAKRLNDLVTIKVSENITGSGKADTSTGRKSTIDAGISDLFGAPLNLNLSNLYGQGNTFSPTVKGSMQNNFEGSGKTARQGQLAGTITARVVEVMPNGNLVLESRKEITINNEKQLLILRGLVRPDDIAADNTIFSSKVADAELYYVGDGIIQEKQSQGWLVRMLDKAWPF